MAAEECRRIAEGTATLAKIDALLKQDMATWNQAAQNMVDQRRRRTLRPTRVKPVS